MFLVDAIDHCQQTTEVDDALAQLDVVIGAKARRIFDVEQRVAASVTLHVLERILTSNGRVAGVELQRNYRRINPLYENIVGSGAVDRAEIPCFVMKAHPIQATCSGGRARSTASTAQLRCHGGCTESSQKFAPIHLFSPLASGGYNCGSIAKTSVTPCITSVALAVIECGIDRVAICYSYR